MQYNLLEKNDEAKFVFFFFSLSAICFIYYHLWLAQKCWRQVGAKEEDHNRFMHGRAGAYYAVRIITRILRNYHGTGSFCSPNYF